MNLFKPSLRNESFDLALCGLNVFGILLAGITVIDSVGSSQVACNVCLRKIKN